MHYINRDKFKIIKYTLKNVKLNLFSKKKKLLKLYIHKVSFVRFHLFFLKVTVNTKFLFNIMFTYFKSFWYLFITLQTKLNYNRLLYHVFYKFFLIQDRLFNRNLIINNNTSLLYPNHILSKVDFSSSTIATPNLIFIQKFIKYLPKKLVAGGIVKNQYFLSQLLYKRNNYSNTKFTLNFLRVQKRYNKRRYSKVRVTSRSSFFGGISLSSIFLALLWGGSIKNIDWISSKIVIIDVNFIILTILAYLFFRIYAIHNPNSFIRKKNKIYILYNLHNLFLLNFFFKK